MHILTKPNRINILSDNSFVETNKLNSHHNNSFNAMNELPVVQITIDSEFHIAANTIEMNI